MAVILEEEITSDTSLAESLIALAKGKSAKPKKVEEAPDEDDVPRKSPKKAKGEDEEDDEETADVEEKDDWEKSEDDEEWDPDFEEFDLPKSKKGKSSKGGEEEDFKVEEEEDFKDLDLFNDGGFEDDAEDDY